MLSINWRAPVAYGHAKSIPPAGFAWEYLRRHGDYHRDFQIISRAKKPTAGLPPEKWSSLKYGY
ncbi:transcriptional regulator domain-containing protein [Methylocystis sp. ATCC 49242]|uniref:transcriptional regulator domain-containing protein n=1 Tax=Methylocystis sp. ATCC 49242 TaxID=622637 RepID=UPI0001F86FA4|nr:DUF6499 domain-containing protein [Methylocystis sp. ATCC 49242]